MLTQLFPFLDPAHIPAELADRLRALAADCEQLRAGRPVPARALKGAPLLKSWVPAPRPDGLRLIGHVSRHRQIKGLIITAPLWFADPAGNWVRTLTQFVRLGPPAHPVEASLLTALTIPARAPCVPTGPEDQA